MRGPSYFELGSVVLSVSTFGRLSGEALGVWLVMMLGAAGNAGGGMFCGRFAGI